MTAQHGCGAAFYRLDDLAATVRGDVVSRNSILLVARRHPRYCRSMIDIHEPAFFPFSSLQAFQTAVTVGGLVYGVQEPAPM